MSDDKGELKHFADGFHEGEWERDVEVPRPWPGLDQVLKDIDVPEEWESVKTMTYEEFIKKYGMVQDEEDFKKKRWIYESPDGGKTIYRREFDNYDNRELVTKEMYEDMGDGHLIKGDEDE
tara:strand:- start:192 stop:554 length:363 start_codon:yes stop_codon:yes gene_type:complete